MSKGQRFFTCSHCGNMAGMIEDKGPPMSCCGDIMTELIPNTVEASKEKHLPSVEKTDKGIKVNVGSVLHPMESEHYIGFVYVETKCGGILRNFEVGGPPEAEFTFIDDKPLAVYAYCNLHGIWKTEL